MELAVVIPTLDEENTIRDCVDSVGTHEEVDIVVCDGGSTDRTREVAENAGVRVVKGPRGRGPQLNMGAASTSAGRLLFLHADCRVPEGWLHAVVRALAARDVSLACFRLRTVSSAPVQRSWVFRSVLQLFDVRSYGLGSPYGDQGFAVRREIFDRVGGFPDIPLMEDVVFARACRRLGRILRLPLEIRTTARRFERHPLRTQLMLAVFPTLFRLGFDPQILARWYGNVR